MSRSISSVVTSSVITIDWDVAGKLSMFENGVLVLYRVWVCLDILDGLGERIVSRFLVDSRYGSAG